MIAPRTLGAGELVTEPGRYTGLSLERYHGQPCDGPSVSSSGLRTIFQQSPAHFWSASSLNPDRIEPPASEALLLGAAAHHLLLGEDDFSLRFVVRPQRFDSWRTNEAKAWKAEQEAAGRAVLLPGQIETVRGMARALAAHPLVAAGILNGEIEQSLFARDPLTGVFLKSRPDAIPNHSGDFCDLKTTISVGFDIDRDIGRYRYDMQAALTKLVAKSAINIDMTSFSFVFVEKEAPYTVDVLTLKDSDIQEAERDLRVAIDTFAHCLKTREWFGPSGRQFDARYAHISDRVRETAMVRRDFLQREIAA